MSDKITDQTRDIAGDLEAVNNFSMDMAYKLRLNAKKEHWAGLEFDHLIKRLYEEIEELEDALLKLSLADSRPDEINKAEAIVAAKLGCADGGNFLMMIHDKLNRMKNDSN